MGIFTTCISMVIHNVLNSARIQTLVPVVSFPIISSRVFLNLLLLRSLKCRRGIRTVGTQVTKCLHMVLEVWLKSDGDGASRMYSLRDITMIHPKSCSIPGAATALAQIHLVGRQSSAFQHPPSHEPWRRLNPLCIRR